MNALALGCGFLFLIAVSAAAALAVRKRWPPIDAGKLADQQHAEALLQALQHEAQAEYHDALAVMYRGRAERLGTYGRRPLTEAEITGLVKAAS